MKLTKLFPIAFLFFGFITSKSFSSTDTMLIATGWGATEKEAIQSAIQNAIETSNGILLLSTSNITNTQLKSDEITTSREGYAKSFKKITSTIIPSMGGMYAVTAKVLVSIEKSTLTSDNSEDSINILFGALETKAVRIAEAKKFIFKWIEAHKNEYGYIISNIKESKRDGYIDVTYKPINNKTFKATITKLIDRLNSFSGANYKLAFVDFINECGGEFRSEWWSNPSVTITYDLSNGRIPNPSNYVALSGDFVQTKAVHDKKF